MNKQEKILYLQKIKLYLKLSKLCDLYNSSHKEKIDYNNLRVMVNGQSDTRLSEKKLDSFITFINDFFLKDILLHSLTNTHNIDSICNIIMTTATETCKRIKRCN